MEGNGDGTRVQYKETCGGIGGIFRNGAVVDSWGTFWARPRRRGQNFEKAGEKKIRDGGGPGNRWSLVGFVVRSEFPVDPSADLTDGPRADLTGGFPNGFQLGLMAGLPNGLPNDPKSGWPDDFLIFRVVSRSSGGTRRPVLPIQAETQIEEFHGSRIGGPHGGKSPAPNGPTSWRPSGAPHWSEEPSLLPPCYPDSGILPAQPRPATAGLPSVPDAGRFLDALPAG